MTKNAPSTTRIYQFVFGLAFLFVSYGAVRTMMYGSTTGAKQIGFLAIAFAAVMWLDNLYWLVLPLCMALNMNVPGLPFDSNELGCISLIGIHFVRMCLHRDATVPWNRKILTAFPLIFWICMIWAINPAGMGILGSGSMGGRFYLKVAFGVGAMFCLSSIRIGEDDCRLLFRVIIAGALLSLVMTMANPQLFASSEDGDSPSTRYFLLVFASVYQLIFARHSLSEILKSAKLFFITALSALAIGLSGKRSTTASVALIPLYRVFLTGRQVGLTLAIGLSLLVPLTMLVAMDGHYVELPRSSKRALAMVFPKYRRQGYVGMRDPFREELAARAKELIREHPWVGRKGFRMDSETMFWLVGNQRGGAFGGHAFSGSWHSAFYAFPADFGIPCLVFYLFFLWCAVRNVIRTCRRISPGTYRHACLLYYGFLILHNGVACLYTSGHSSKTTMYMTIFYGMFLAVSNGETEHHEQLLLPS